jgi:hypothetical protein
MGRIGFSRPMEAQRRLSSGQLYEGPKSCDQKPDLRTRSDPFVPVQIGDSSKVYTSLHASRLTSPIFYTVRGTVSNLQDAQAY